MIVEFIICVVFSIFFGLFNAWLFKMLDFMMQYGHIFERVRLYFAAQYAVKADVEDYFLNTLEEIQKETFTSRMESVEELYWQIASLQKKFVLWLCVYCLSIRAIFFLTILVFLTSFFTSCFAWYHAIAFGIISSVVNFATLYLND